MITAKEAQELMVPTFIEMDSVESLIKEAAVKGQNEIVMSGGFWSDAREENWIKARNILESNGFKVKFIHDTGWRDCNAKTRIGW